MLGARAFDPRLAKARRRALIAYDGLVWLVCVPAFAMLRYMDSAGGTPWGETLTATAIAIGAQWLIGTWMWIYDGRYPIGSKDETLALAATTLSAGFVLQLVSIVFPGGRLIAISVPVGATAMATLGALAGRVAFRMVRESSKRPKASTPVLIFGAGDAASQLVSNMVTDPDSPYLPVGLLDDDSDKRHLRIERVRVLGNRTALESAVRRTGAEGLIIAVPTAGPTLYRELSDQARALGLVVQVLPGLSELFDGQVGFRDLRDINISDLLGRAPVDTDVEAVAAYLAGKRVLVTGAGGSIGSELCRQIARFSPGRLLMLDRDESALHALQLSLTGRAMLDSDDMILADIRDRPALTEVFEKHRPQVVFHAAALKHLPMLEQYPEEAWKTNVLGTANVLEAARDVGVEVFVNISTDKAANPCSVLGYSKRLAERLTAGVAAETPGKFVSVRFGNVIGSRGSVIPAFAEQIARGGPVTVTDPDVTRFFMMIPEACELVIQAAAVGRDGEALVLDMGQPVRILDVARQMIRMSGREDVEIVFTGLRDGEKAHEELFGAAEGQRQTGHPLIEGVPVPALGIGEVRASEVGWAEAVEFG